MVQSDAQKLPKVQIINEIKCPKLSRQTSSIETCFLKVHISHCRFAVVKIRLTRDARKH